VRLEDDIVEESFVADIVFANSVHVVVGILTSLETHSSIVDVIGLHKVPVVLIEEFDIISVVSSFGNHNSFIFSSSCNNEEHGDNSLHVGYFFEETVVGETFLHEFSGGESDFLLSDEDFSQDFEVVLDTLEDSSSI